MHFSNIIHLDQVILKIIYAITINERGNEFEGEEGYMGESRGRKGKGEM